jgi:hypothetical protein
MIKGSGSFSPVGYTSGINVGFRQRYSSREETREVIYKFTLVQGD